MRSNKLAVEHAMLKGPFALSGILLAFYVFTIVAWSQVSEASATYSKLVGIGLTFSFCIEFLANRRKTLHFPKGIAILAFFVLWNAISFFWAQDEVAATRGISTLFQLLVFSIVAMNILIFRASLPPVFAAFLGGLVWAILNAIKANNYSLAQTSATQFGSVLVNANLYSIALTIGLLLTFYLYPNRSRPVKFLLLGYCIIAIHQIFFFSGSRKGMLAVIIVFSAYFALTFGLKALRSPQVLIVLIVSLIVVYFAGDWLINNSPFGDRLINYQADTSFQTRVGLIDFGFEKWRDNPIIGYGSNQYRILLVHDTGIETYSHNNYIEILTNNGLLGLLLYYSFYLMVIKNYWNLFASGSLSIHHFAWGMTILLLFLLWDFAMVSYLEKIFWVVFSVVTADQWIVKQQRVPDRGPA